MKLKGFVKHQAPAILMPYLRQAISAGTALSRFGQLLIPPINVVAVLEDMEKAETQQQEIEQP
ncbi:MAG: protein-export chaperone SecB [Gemmatimonadetes bacterium]|nr:protein-export chaperone SecB [Gemmatimonadota bacterium]